jgi:uncharacterized membrane protein (UPF0127 family)
MFRRFLLALLIFFAPFARADESLRLTLSVDAHSIEAEVATTESTRARGLMHRSELAENAGMLFMFSRPGAYSLWMANTLIPLDAAFLDNTGVILEIVSMSPHDSTIRSSPENTAYALETNAGWFSRRGIKPGARVQGLPSYK